MAFWKNGAFLFLMSVLLTNCGSPTEGGCAAWNSSDGHPMVGTQALNFILPNLAGEKMELAPLVAEKPVLLVFWATWCPSCLEEIPILNEWVVKYPQLQILGVNVQDSLERVQSFARNREIRYPVLLDPDAEVASQYGLVGIPASILFQKGGKIVYYGFSLPEDVEALIHGE